MRDVGESQWDSQTHTYSHRLTDYHTHTHRLTDTHTHTHTHRHTHRHTHWERLTLLPLLAGMMALMVVFGLCSLLAALCLTCRLGDRAVVFACTLCTSESRGCGSAIGFLLCECVCVCMCTCVCSCFTHTSISLSLSVCLSLPLCTSLSPPPAPLYWAFSPQPWLAWWWLRSWVRFRNSSKTTLAASLLHTACFPFIRTSVQV